MAANPVVSNASVVAGLNALLALLNAGGAGQIKIWTGSPPATCETGDSGIELVALALSATAFPTAVDNAAGGATATANTITAGVAINTGTAGYFRAYSGAGTCIDQGTCGTSAADMIMSNTAINSADIVSCSSWAVTLPDGSGSD